MPTVIDEVTVEQMEPTRAAGPAPTAPATAKPDMARIKAELRRDEARMIRLATD